MTWHDHGRGTALEGLERENKELRRANDILHNGQCFFAQAGLDRKMMSRTPASTSTGMLSGSSVCKVLLDAPSPFRCRAARQRNPEPLSARALRDERLTPHRERVWHANMQVYGAHKFGKQI